MCTLTMLLLYCTITITICAATECWPPSKTIYKANKAIIKIFDKPPKLGGDKLIENINLYASTITSLGEQLKVNDSIFEECNKVYREGMAPFLLYCVDDKKLAELKKKFKWTNEQVNNFNLLMTNADSEWMIFLKIWFAYVKKLPTTTEHYNYFSPDKFEVLDGI